MEGSHALAYVHKTAQQQWECWEQTAVTRQDSHHYSRVWSLNVNDIRLFFTNMAEKLRTSQRSKICSALKLIVTSKALEYL